MEQRNEDGHGNTLQYMKWKELKEWISENPALWVKGDKIQVSNIDGSVIATTILIENGEEAEREENRGKK